MRVGTKKRQDSSRGRIADFFARVDSPEAKEFEVRPDFFLWAFLVAVGGAIGVRPKGWGQGIGGGALVWRWPAESVLCYFGDNERASWPPFVA